MTTRIEEIRREQLLSTTFVAGLLNLEPQEYVEIEKKGFESSSSHLQSQLITLFGVEEKDLKDSNKKNKANQYVVGLARTYDKISEKDKEEINRLSNYKKIIMKRRLYE